MSPPPKLADIPLAKPGFDALNMTAPVMVQMNPEGKWENSKPENMDEKKLQSVVQYLVNSKTVSAAQSYCCQCAKEGQVSGGSNNTQYVPVIMMPIYSADQCPFDMNCEVNKIKAMEKDKPKKKVMTKSKDITSSGADSEEGKKKQKKKGFVMQRLTDFDLLSQW